MSGNWFRSSVTVAVLAIGVATAGRAAAQSASDAPVASARLSSERAEQFAVFTDRWGSFVEQAYGVDAGTWRARMAEAFMQADPMNVADALTRQSFSSAMAALEGAAHRVAETADGTTAGRLGDVGNDLTYTPIVPCRIVDTRNTAPASPLSAGGTRSFLAIAVDYSTQGGSATGCGVSSERPGAVVLNVTMVTPDRPGYATVFPFGVTQPFTASVNYVSGAIVNNTVVTQVPDPAAASDFSIFSTGAGHVVVDLVGFYDTPQATPASCVNATTDVPLADRTSSQFTPNACPAGYTGVSVLCAPTVVDPLVELLNVTPSVCEVNNRSFSAITVTVGRRCCRVPGR